MSQPIPPGYGPPVVPYCVRCRTPIYGTHASTPSGPMHYPCAEATYGKPAPKQKSVVPSTRVVLLAGIGFVVLVIAVVGTQAITGAGKATAGGGARTAPSPPVPYTMRDGFDKGGRHWQFVLVRQAMSRADMVRLARWIHAHESGCCFYIVDDPSGIDDYVRWTEHYPSDAHPFPEQWVKKHMIATTARRPNGTKYIESSWGQKGVWSEEL